MIPVVDLFAGPGGLGEGFSTFRNDTGFQPFRIVLSIEKDPIAHQTLRLRSFFRQFPAKEAPDAYYDCLRGSLSLQELYALYPEQSAKSHDEAWNATLGDYRKVSARKIEERITNALGNSREWVLIGGPPCQAYSIAGRSRVIPVNPERYEKDKRHFLYRAYLRIIAEHRPSVFVMENVKGILSAEVAGSRIIDRILNDLRHPLGAAQGKVENDEEGGVEYKIFPLADYERGPTLFELDIEPKPSDYIIRTEYHRIPQARHRLILVGVRSDLLKGKPTVRPGRLRNYKDAVSMWAAINDLPRLRSKLSNGSDSGLNWASIVRSAASPEVLSDSAMDAVVAAAIRAKVLHVNDSLPTGAEFMPCDGQPKFRPDWYRDSRLGGVCNHTTRSHMDSDLLRYFFLACYAEVNKKSPKLTQFPVALLPNHQNVKDVEREKIVFKDRFRVQVRSKPATTVTSHIGKDGHYFIHPDPLQCRSLTVREAARLQTFPDNYFFVGPITAKYQQVGNAVPPLLARQIAAVVYRALSAIH